MWLSNILFDNIYKAHSQDPKSTLSGSELKESATPKYNVSTWFFYCVSAMTLTEFRLGAGRPVVRNRLYLLLTVYLRSSASCLQLPARHLGSLLSRKFDPPLVLASSTIPPPRYLGRRPMFTSPAHTIYMGSKM